MLTTGRGMTEWANGGPIEENHDSIPFQLDPHCTYYIPRSQLPENVMPAEQWRAFAEGTALPDDAA